MKKFLLILPITALLLGACGPEPEPTPSMDEIQGTAVAGAFTMIAQTQAAIPTATSIPPTATPLPTETPLPTAIPTEVVLGLPSPTATLASGEDDCNHILASGAPGPEFPLKIENETKAPVTISVYLAKTVFGECGYRSYSIGPKSSTLVTFKQGTIYGYAWVNDPKTPTTLEGGPWVPNNSDKWTIYIRDNSLKFVGP